MRDFIAGPVSYAKEHKVGCSCFSILDALAFSTASRIHMVGTVADLTNYISEPNLSTFFFVSGELCDLFSCHCNARIRREPRNIGPVGQRATTGCFFRFDQLHLYLALCCCFLRLQLLILIIYR